MATLARTHSTAGVYHWLSTATPRQQASLGSFPSSLTCDSEWTRACVLGPDVDRQLLLPRRPLIALTIVVPVVRILELYATRYMIHQSAITGLSKTGTGRWLGDRPEANSWYDAFKTWQGTTTPHLHLSKQSWANSFDHYANIRNPCVTSCLVVGNSSGSNSPPKTMLIRPSGPALLLPPKRSGVDLEGVTKLDLQGRATSRTSLLRGVPT